MGKINTYRVDVVARGCERERSVFSEKGITNIWLNQKNKYEYKEGIVVGVMKELAQGT